jgi:hypothetical protein
MDHNNNYINEKIDFAKSVLEHNLSLINLADTKAGILLGINGVVLALLFGIERNTYSFEYTFFLSHSNSLWSLKHICDLNADT